MARKKKKAPSPSVPARSVGRPAHQPTEETRKQVELYAATGFPHSIIADLLDIESVNTLKKHYPRELATGEPKMIALATNGVAMGLAKKEPWAIQYVLSHKGKKYGWTKGTELTGAGGKDLFAGMNLGGLNDAQFQQLMELLKLAGVNIES